MAGRKNDLSISAAFMHVAVELMAALGVTTASGVTVFTAAQPWFDLGQ